MSYFRSHGDYDSLPDRFHEKIENVGNCWIWLGAKRCGYARMYVYEFRKVINADRVSWMLYKGEYPDWNLDVCHTCDNPSCVNPQHLFLGTAQTNVDDMCSKGRNRYTSGEKSHLSKLTSSDVLSIRELLRLGYSMRQVADLFGVSKSAINHIKQKRSWKELETGLA